MHTSCKVFPNRLPIHITALLFQTIYQILHQLISQMIRMNMGRQITFLALAKFPHPLRLHRQILLRFSSTKWVSKAAAVRC